MPHNSATIVLLASDLMLSSTVSGLAAEHHVRFVSASNVQELSQILNEHPQCLLLIDLGLPGLDVTQLAPNACSETLQTAVAYGPHVHKEKLQAAREAGIGQVVSRGQFSASIGRVVASWVSGDGVPTIQ